MIFKVKHNELNQVSDTIKRDSEDYSSEVDSMLKDIESLRSVWQGVDAEEFCDNMEVFLKNVKNIPTAMSNMSNAIKVIDKGYVDCDTIFGDALKAEANNYEE